MASLTPGHTFDIVRQMELNRLVRNATAWVTGEGSCAACGSICARLRM